MRRSFGSTKPIENSPIHYTLYSDKLITGHNSRILRKYIKIVVFITRPDWTCYMIKTRYYPEKNRVEIDDCLFHCYDKTVVDTSSLKSFEYIKEQIEDYYKLQFISFQKSILVI